jgi:hypothetical protein
LKKINLIKKSEVGMGKKEKQFLTAMAWNRGELDRGGTFCHL